MKSSWASSYVRVESHNAPEYLCQVADQDDDEADHGERDDEAGVAAQQAGGRNYGEDQLERFLFYFVAPQLLMTLSYVTRSKHDLT